MKRTAVLNSVALALVLAGTVLTPSLRADEKTPAPELKLKVGDAAPDFKLQYFDGHELKNVSLDDYRGKKNVVLAFYVFAFTGG